MHTAEIDVRRSRGVGELVASLSLCALVAGIGSYWTLLGLGPWYDGLAKPSWNAPDWAFGPVWTKLYFLMAVAAYLIWRIRAVPDARRALKLYGAQLALNLAWPGIFFGLRMPGAACLEVAALWVAVAATVAAFFRVRPAAGWLMVPYLLWVTYASALNVAIWWLNRSPGP